MKVEINNLYNKLNAMLVTLLWAGLMVSCDDESEISNPVQSIGGIPDAAREIFEDEQIRIPVRFNKAASESAAISISFSGTAVYGEDFTTEPAGNADGASLSISAGDSGTELTIIAIQEDGLNDDKILELDFESSGGVEFGTQSSAEVAIINKPEINVVQSLVDFGDVVEFETSTEQSFRVSGAGLTGDLSIVATPNFGVSLDNTDFSEMVTLSADDINAKDTTVYVRFAPEFDNLSNQTGTITLESENANDVSFGLSGTGVSQPPTLFLSENSFELGTAPQGGVTNAVSYEVTGYRLTENVQVTAPENFEVSLDNAGFSNVISLDFQTINAFEAVMVYVRFAPNSGINGLKTGNVVHSSAGISDMNVEVSGTEGLDLIAYTSFEEPTGLDVDYTDTGDPAINRTLINNPGEAPVQYTSSGGELGFRTIYISTGGVGATDGDDLGVTNKSSIVGTTAEGGYTDGTQGYYADDTDGIIQLILDEVDVTGLSVLRVSLDYLFNDASWEPEDNILITLTTDQGVPATLLSLNGDDIEGMGLDPEPHVWNSLDVDVSSLLPGASSVELRIQIQTDAGSEEVYFDNIRFLGN